MLKIDDLGKCFGLGTAGLSGNAGGYSFGEVKEDDAVGVIRKAKEVFGVKVFDTAPIYGFGEAENRLGKAIQENREDFFVVTKTGVGWHSNKRVNMTNCPKHTKKMLEDSMRRLGTDYVDAVLVHWPDSNVDIRKTYEVLAKAKMEGKVRYIGLSNTNKEEIKFAKEVDSIDMIQGECNIFNKTELMSLDENNEFYKTSWGSFDKGIATGRVYKNRVFDSSDCRSWAPWWKKSGKDQKINKVKLLSEKISTDNNSLKEEFLVKFSIETIKRSGVQCPFFGVKNEFDLNSLGKLFHANLDDYPVVKDLLKGNDV